MDKGQSGVASASIRRLLLLQPRWMGDVLLATPAIREARRAFPNAKIDFATEGAGGEVLRKNPYLDEVLVDRKKLGSRLRLLSRVAAGGYDAVVDFRSTGSTAQLALVSRARIRVGVRGRGPRNRVYTHLVERQELDLYAARHKLDMLRVLGVDTAGVCDLSLDLTIEATDRAAAERIWQENRLESERVVAISPVSREEYKQWGAAKWAEVADGVAGLGARALLTSGPGELDQVREVAGLMQSKPLWDYGRTTIAGLAAILERCVLWIGNDGGTKHIAAAAGVPTISIGRWQIGPVWTDSTAAAVQQFIDRAPPGGCDMRCPGCKHLGCLAAITPEDVLVTIRSSLRA